MFAASGIIVSSSSSVVSIWRHNKALTAITAKVARVVHAVIKNGSDYRPFFEGKVPGGRTPLSSAVRAQPRPCR